VPSSIAVIGRSVVAGTDALGTYDGFRHLRRLLNLPLRILLRGRPGAYCDQVFPEQHTPEQVTTYEVAREFLGRQLGQALAAAAASGDPAQKARYEAEASAAVARRKALRVGTPEAEQIVADAKAARQAALARE